MSAIGDYIHYTLYGYSRQSTIDRDPFIFEAKKSLDATHAYIKNKIKNMNDRGNAKKIQDILNRTANLYGSYTINDNKIQQIYDEAWLAYVNGAEKGIQKRLQTDIYKVVAEGAEKGMVVNTQGLEATTKIKTTKIGQGAYVKNLKDAEKTIRIMYKEIGVQLDVLSKNIRKIENLTAETLKLMQKTYRSLEKEMTKLSILVNNINKTRYDINEQGQIGAAVNIDGKIQDIIVTLKKQFDLDSKPTEIDMLKYGGVIDKLNTLAAIINANCVAAMAIGESFEAGFPPVFQQLSQYLPEYAKNSVLQTLSSVKQIGEDRSRKAYQHNLFSAYIKVEDIVKGDASKKPKTVNIDNKYYTIISNFKTQNKADVELVYKSGKKNFISLKNSNKQVSNLGFQIVGGSPLLYMIQSYNQYDFVNHYLNYDYALRAWKRGTEDTERLKQPMHKVMSEVILLSALTQVGAISIDGNIKGYPDLFCFRETYPTQTRGQYKDQFRVITMYDLFNILMQNPTDYINFGDTFKRAEGRIDSKSFVANFEQPSIDGYLQHANRRITWILAQVHKQKITVKITRKAVVNRLRNESKAIPQ